MYAESNTTCVNLSNPIRDFDEKFQDVVGEVEEAIHKSRHNSRLLDIQYSWVHCYPPVEINPDSFAVKKKIEASKAVKGHREYIYGGLSVSSDMGFVAEALKPQAIDVACFGPGSRGAELSAHGPDEFVFIDDLVAMSKELAYYLVF